MTRKQALVSHQEYKLLHINTKETSVQDGAGPPDGKFQEDNRNKMLVGFIYYCLQSGNPEFYKLFVYVAEKCQWELVAARFATSTGTTRWRRTPENIVPVMRLRSGGGGSIYIIGRF